MPHNFDTLSQAINDLRTRGYEKDLNLKSDCLICQGLAHNIQAEEFEVDEVYRFEGDSNPADASILYAISSTKYDLKGILVDAYGAYADPLTTEMIQKLRYKPS